MKQDRPIKVRVGKNLMRNRQSTDLDLSNVTDKSDRIQGWHVESTDLINPLGEIKSNEGQKSTDSLPRKKIKKPNVPKLP